VDTGEFVQYMVSGVTMGSVYAIVALGFTIIYSVTGIINFAQGEFVMLGGMTMYVMLDSFGLPLAGGLFLALVIVTMVGMALEIVAVRPARNASVISLIIITIGASILIRGVAGQLWGKEARPLPPFTGEHSLHFLGASILPQTLWVLGVTLLVMLVLHLFFNRTMLGKALRACSSNRRASALMGINARTMSTISFGLSALLGGLGGVLVAPMTMTSYDVGVMLGLKGFVGAAMGGFTSQLGAVLGGMGLGIFEALSAGYISSAYKDAIALSVLFAVLFVRVGLVPREGSATA